MASCCPEINRCLLSHLAFGQATSILLLYCLHYLICLSGWVKKKNITGDSSVNVIAIKASVHLPFDHRMLVQNLTTVVSPRHPQIWMLRLNRVSKASSNDWCLKNFSMHNVPMCHLCTIFSFYKMWLFFPSHKIVVISHLWKCLLCSCVMSSWLWTGFLQHVFQSDRFESIFNLCYLFFRDLTMLRCRFQLKRLSRTYLVWASFCR